MDTSLHPEKGNYSSRPATAIERAIVVALCRLHFNELPEFRFESKLECKWLKLSFKLLQLWAAFNVLRRFVGWPDNKYFISVIIYIL